MKKSIMILLAVSMLAASVPALATEHKAGQHDAKCQRECEMLVRNCSLEVDTIQQKIQKLQFAIQNNAGKYTSQELNSLKDDLEDAQTMLANIERGA